jgi:hypothetical protein
VARAQSDAIVRSDPPAQEGRLDTQTGDWGIRLDCAGAPRDLKELGHEM